MSDKHILEIAVAAGHKDQFASKLRPIIALNRLLESETPPDSCEVALLFTNVIAGLEASGPECFDNLSEHISRIIGPPRSRKPIRKDKKDADNKNSA